MAMNMSDFLTLCATVREALGKMTRGEWRVGSKVGRTIYNGLGPDDLLGVVDMREDAAGIVLLRNHVPTLLDGIETLQREKDETQQALNEAAGLIVRGAERQAALTDTIEQREQENARLRAALDDLQTLLTRRFELHDERVQIMHDVAAKKPGARERLHDTTAYNRECDEIDVKLRAALGGGA